MTTHSFIVMGLCVVLLCCVFPNMSHGQVPGELVPGRQQQQTAPPEPLSQPTPDRSLPDMIQQEPPEAAKEVELFLTDIIVTGMSIMDPEDIDFLWEDDLWKDVPVSRLYEIATSITKYYADQGYALSFAFVPEQEISEEGAVHIRVVEGYIEQAVFIGDMGRANHPGTALIRDMTSRIVASRPLRTDSLQRYLLLMNDFPGLKVETTFSASRTTPNASNLIVKIERDPYNLSLSANNELSDTLGPISRSLALQVNGFVTGADGVSVSMTCALDCDDYQNVSFAWSTYLSPEGLKAGFNYTKTLIKPTSGDLFFLEFEGDNTSIGFNVSYPLLRSRQENLTVGSDLVFTHNITETFLGTLSEDQVRTLSAYATYDVADPTGGVSLIKGTISQGLPIFDYTSDDSTTKSRANGSSVFTKAELLISRTQPLGYFSPDLSPYSVYVSGLAQAALADPLLSSAQCFYGGQDFGRGYSSGAIGGDHCLLASAELRRDVFWKQFYLQPYGYLDAGLVFKKGLTAPGEADQIGAQSAGFGMRWSKGSSNLSGDMRVAWPLRTSQVSNGKDTPRMTMNVNWLFD